MSEPEYVEAGREYQRQYYLAHREKKLAYQAAYYTTHRATINARRRRPRADPRVQAGEGEYQGQYYLQIKVEGLGLVRLEALRRISGLEHPRCCQCGDTDIRVLTINHRNGDGASERRSDRSNGLGFTKAVADGLRSTDDLDVRCYNCNIRYEYERGRRRLPRVWTDLGDA